MIEPLLTEDGAARVLNVSKGTLRNWRCQGKGPPVTRIGCAVRYDPAHLRDYVDVRTRHATVAPGRRGRKKAVAVLEAGAAV